MLTLITTVWNKTKYWIIAGAVAVLYILGYRRGKEKEQVKVMKGTVDNVKTAKKVGIAWLILSVLSGCTTNISGDFCLLYEPVYADYERDTPETVRQIDRNNLIYDDLCKKLAP